MIKKSLILALLLVGTACSKDVGRTTRKPLIEKVAVHKNRVDITINKRFKRRYLRDDFFVEYADDIDLEQFDYSIVTLPFIMNVISLVWISGEDYEVDEMDAEVYESLQRIKDVFKIFHPKTPWNGRLIPKKLVSHTYPALKQPQERIALLFSGGIDSTTSSIYHKDTKQLLITAWGQSALPLHQPKLWQTIKGQISSFARQYGHDIEVLKSNYYYFLNLPKLKTISPEIVTWRIDTIEDIGWAGLIAPILLARGISTLRIASSDNWDIPYASAANPYIDSNISFAGIKIYHDLFSMSRHDKIAYIVDLCNKGQIRKPQFIVCQKPGGIINCAHCEKCCLTLAQMLSIGADPREYGYSESPKKAAKNIMFYLDTEDEISISTIWEYTELQKKLRKRRYPLLDKLLTIDFAAEKKACDIKDSTTTIDWKELDALYPHVKKETT